MSYQTALPSPTSDTLQPLAGPDVAREQDEVIPLANTEQQPSASLMTTFYLRWLHTQALFSQTAFISISSSSCLMLHGHTHYLLRSPLIQLTAIGFHT
jgi:hypothetical protein